MQSGLERGNRKSKICRDGFRSLFIDFSANINISIGGRQLADGGGNAGFQVLPHRFRMGIGSIGTRLKSDGLHLRKGKGGMKAISNSGSCTRS